MTGADDHECFASVPTGVQRRPGMKYVATLEHTTERLEVKMGRLCAFSNGMWHIVSLNRDR